jgi:Sec-independent protein translocase protein TatA
MIWILILIIAIGLITFGTYQKKEKTLREQVDSHGGMSRKYRRLIDGFENQLDTEVVKVSRDEVVIKSSANSTDNIIKLTELYREVQITWLLSIGVSEKHKKVWEFPENYPQDKIYEELKEHIEWATNQIFGKNYNNSLNKNKNKITINNTSLNTEWNLFLEKKDISLNFKEVIHNFLIKDNISFEKYFQNQEANEICKEGGLKNWEKAQSLSVYKHKKENNCTKTFRENFADNILKRSPMVAEWFYIAYPDVEVWFHDKRLKYKDEVMKNENKYFKNDEATYALYRFIIDEYLKSNYILECSNKIPKGLTKGEYIESLIWDESGETPYD